ncbi:MAG TPA: hypothetical protein VD906_09730 [Caulobacteraceae bacterium]|nr:hypothetical protein [Caulobacteraceae bacterium]
MSRTLSIAAIAAAGAALSGCASNAAPVSGYAWSYQQIEGEGEKLAYGAPNSDDVVMMMTCEPGSGRVIMSALVDQMRDQLVLASGGEQRAYPAIGGTSELDGGAVVEAEGLVDRPVLDRFARTGELAMLTGRERVSLAARGEERTSIGRFFERCQA